VPRHGNGVGSACWKSRGAERRVLEISVSFLESFVPMCQSELPSLRHLLIAKREHRSLRGGERDKVVEHVGCFLVDSRVGRHMEKKRSS